MLLTKDFEETVLLNPAIECNSLKIITGYMDCERIATHSIALQSGIEEKKFESNLQVEILLGMTKSRGSLSPKKHLDICRTLSRINSSKNMPRIKCRYICAGSEVHSKIYIWSKNQEAQKAWCGSVNYTMNAFYKRRESLADCDAFQAMEYYNSLLPDTLDCYDGNVFDSIKNIKNTELDNDDWLSSEEEYDLYDKLIPVDTLEVSLLKADGSDTGFGSGVNWGIRQNETKRNQNQAYIPYNAQDKKDGFFPDRLNPTDKNCPVFKVITKDAGSFHMRMAQAGNKGLHSVESNAILGEWIRERIGAASGGYVTKAMLEKYGKTKVKFRKYSDGVYLMDF